MRFQRYPDGGAHWTWFVWSRHPENSITWTHSLSVTRWRHWSLRPRLIWDRVGAQRSYGAQWLGASVTMMRQQPMWKNVNAG